MNIQRNYRVRIYPTEAQVTLLKCWEGIARFIWNYYRREYREAEKFNEGKSTKECKVVSQKTQQLGMTQLQKLPEYAWIQELQCQARQDVLANLSVAWRRYKAKQRTLKTEAKTDEEKQKAKKKFQPKYKEKGDSVRLYFPTATVDYEKTAHSVVFKGKRFEGLGPLKARFDRELPGRITSWSIIREVHEWYLVAACDYTIPDPIPEATKPVIGIDRGVTLVLADSNGRTVPKPDFFNEMAPQIARAQRRLSKRTKGSKNWYKEKTRLAKKHLRFSRRREVFLHTEAKHYADAAQVVVLEDLKVSKMTKSAKGTKEKPGKNVAQKAGLNRAILNSGWGMFSLYLQYKVKERGGIVAKVPPHHTSQECNQCGHVDADNRKTQAQFKCTKCGHTENADTNAAKSIKNRFMRGDVCKEKAPPIKISKWRRKTKLEKTAVKATGAACGGPPVTEPMNQELPPARVETACMGDTLKLGEIAILIPTADIVMETS